MSDLRIGDRVKVEIEGTVLNKTAAEVRVNTGSGIFWGPIGSATKIKPPPEEESVTEPEKPEYTLHRRLEYFGVEVWVIRKSSDPVHEWRGYDEGSMRTRLGQWRRFNSINGTAWEAWTRYMSEINPAEKFIQIDPAPEEESVTDDYKKQYEDLVKALAAEAERRNWCDEFDTFAKQNNIPAEILNKKVQVTLEIDLPRGRHANKAEVTRELTRISGASLATRVVDWKVI